MKRVCCLCKVEKEITLFPRDNRPNRNNLGYDYRCKECMKKVKSEFRSKHPDRFSIHSNKWVENNREKKVAHRAVNEAIRRGDIKKPERCQICKKKSKLDGHHWHGYSKDHRLDVQWLCRQCHKNAG